MEELASVIWGELKRYINTVDRAEAAETLVQILMDSDCEVDDIKDAFNGDREIKTALTSYLDDDNDYTDDEEEEIEEEDEDEDWEN